MKFTKSKIILFGIIILASFLRFYNYPNRWALAHDQARDAVIGREAIRQLDLPVLGPFSQAGTFVMGPLWYWWTAASYIVYPSLLGPWIILTLSYVLLVYIMFLCGKELMGKKSALLLGFLTAISPSQIFQSTNLTNPSGVAIWAGLAFYFSIRYIKSGRSLFIFLSAFCIAFAMNLHLQAIGLTSFVLLMLVLRKPKLKSIFFLLLGLLIPFLPLIVFDIKNDFYDTKSMLDYYFYGQHRIYIANRWLTYLGVFWPTAWARVIGGELIIGYIIGILISIVTVITLIKRKLTKQMIFTIISFLLVVLMLRYFKGAKYDSYLIFINPVILALTAWALVWFYRFNKYLAVLLFLAVTFFTLRVDFIEIANSTNRLAAQTRSWMRVLEKKYPGKKFAVYDYEYKTAGNSISLGLILDDSHKIDDNGIKVGLVFASSSATFKEYKTVLGGASGEYKIVDLSRKMHDTLLYEGWKFVNPSGIYDSTERWYKNKK